MKKSILFLCTVAPLLSMEISPTEASTSTDAITRDVMALSTKPKITGSKSFRVVLRLSSTKKIEIPYAVLYGGTQLTGWEAATSSPSKCSVQRRSGISNTPNLEGKRADAPSLKRYDGAEATMGPNRPVNVIVDFKCDEPIYEKDEVSIQTAFFFRLGSTWKKEVFLFDKQTLTK